MYDGDEHLFAALEAGASAFVLKSRARRPTSSAPPARPPSPPPPSPPRTSPARCAAAWPTPAVPLTPRESELLQLLADGGSIADIAGRLYISQSTAKTHLSKLYEKLGAANRAQAVMAAVRLGLLSAS